jgi:hypothetical protein
MNTIGKYIRMFLLLLIIAKLGIAQDYRTYKNTEAVMLQVKGNTITENRLKKVIIALSNNSSSLNVRLNIPYHSINYQPATDSVILSPQLAFNLKVDIDLWQIQNYLTSAKMFNTQGSLTLNNITKSVKVEYLPMPAGTDMDGEINLSMVIQFDPGDFNLDEQQANSQFIIKISDATVSRL